MLLGLGAVLAEMNLVFYLAVARLPLATAERVRSLEDTGVVSCLAEISPRARFRRWRT